MRMVANGPRIETPMGLPLASAATVAGAAEIVRRWNAHADLLAACEAVLAWSEKHGHPVYADKCNEPGNIVRSALAQARGPS